MSLQKLVDMRKTPAEKAEDAVCMPMGVVNEYPYGLCMSLCDEELEKLDVDYTDLQVGDIIDMRAMARVTSVSKNETEVGERIRVELQIVLLGIESESEEVDEPRSRLKNKRG